jgi:hypothetical protein
LSWPRILTWSSFSTFVTPWTRCAAAVASRFSRKLPTVARSVTRPFPAFTAIARSSTPGVPAQLVGDALFEVAVRHLDSFRFPSMIRKSTRERIGGLADPLRDWRTGSVSPPINYGPGLR